MKTYELVFIDADETLFDFRKAERFALDKAFAGAGLPLTGRTVLDYEEINAGVWRQLEQGKIDQERLKVERFRLLFERLGLDADPRPLSASYLEWLGRGAFLLPGAEETCAWLASKYTLAIVTNGIKEVQRSRIGSSPIAGYFAAVIVSEEAGCSKPDPGIFEYACGRLGFHDTSRMIMVGDSLSSDIRGGVNFGIDTCWLNPEAAPNDTDLRPTYEIRDLAGLRAIL